MASKLIAFDTADDDYIDMEVTSYSNFFCHSHPQPGEFEFQMSSIDQEKDSTTSPADELFYKGKLLPLHLPPRLQMVEKILQNSDPPFVMDKVEAFEEFFSTPLTTTYTTPTSGTPFESCNISPVESCQVSRELNPEDYKLEFPSTGTSDEGFTVESNHHQKKSWTKKLKHSSIGSKLRASRAYLKSWFGKSGCSYENYATSTKVADEGSVSKANNNNLSKKKKNNNTSSNPYGQIRYESSNSVMKNNGDDPSSNHRRSFSVGIKILSGNKSSLSTGSSSFSIPNKSSRQHLKRCSSASSEIENAIQGAIAHCKKSQQTKKNSSEVGFYSFSEDQERVVLLRG
ncbi:hypothetical protein HN51_056475 [Arachis hypogaea]|uniref:Putative membrane-associated kinase regulator n=2 Tax=Arachis TaxID=3817 RepID=A0A444XU11_ARAHY|nr:probable membrane-associated kinase regulator 4 [Arachis hypogaea]QHN79343.1 putative membrane-associated kinase regulator [Arachis hypogaea]RYQ93277.1 hypothetical protein Ahy_B09g099543 [Arachis hypogaea]